MKRIYDLKIALDNDAERVAHTQALTLNKDRPKIGLSGKYGLFGSPEWWNNLYTGVIPTKRFEGIITSLQFEGQNNDGRSFTIEMPENSLFTYSLMANDKKDFSAYKIGNRLAITMLIEPKKTGENIDFVWTIECWDD